MGHFLKKLYLKLPVIFFDVFCIPIAWYVAYFLRFNLELFPPALMKPQALSVFWGLMVTQVLCYYGFRVYRGLWRFSSINDVVRILKSSVCSVIVIVPILYMFSWLSVLPRSILPLYSMILTALLCGGRIFLRYYGEFLKKRVRNAGASAKRILIVGAGRAAESLVRDLKRTMAYVPVALVDDDRDKRGLEVHGIRVLGTISQIPDLVKRQQVDLIFIAIPSVSSVDMRRIVYFCEQSGVLFRTLPGLDALAHGQVEVNALRQVNIDDLLGRDQVDIEWDKVASCIERKRILVTGGGGSIGAELCRQIMKLSPSHLFIIDNNEYNLYSIEQELGSVEGVEYALVSVTDRVAVNALCQRVKPDIIFHAAAYKHVPMLEHQVRVAVQNNILGTQIVAQAAVAVQATKFVLISTDKAVNPANVMGMTKRIAEIYCQNLNRHSCTQFITVRFGNVLGSAGSVVPLFQKQIASGGPVTVTHPDIQRYFMTIPEASQLILQAMANGLGGEIFVLDMGEPIYIRYLAEQMIRLAGKELGKDIQIKYVGLRPGEKLFEELFHDSEDLIETEHTKLFRAKFRAVDWDNLMSLFDEIERACDRFEEHELLGLMKSLVPEFHVSLPALEPS